MQRSRSPTMVRRTLWIVFNGLLRRAAFHSASVSVAPPARLATSAAWRRSSADSVAVDKRARGTRRTASVVFVVCREQLELLLLFPVRQG